MGKGIFEAINGVMADIGAIGKGDFNAYDKYSFRGIDAVYNAVQPALIKNGVFIVPNLLEMEQTDRQSKKGDMQIHTRVKVAFRLCASDGTSIESVFPGEAIDRSDKSINKAMTAAYKYMIFELFCIPTKDLADADEKSYDVGQRQAAIVTNRDKLITFCRNNRIDLVEVAQRFELDNRSTDKQYMDALNTLMDEITPGLV